jgi:hypothetical protein
LNIVPPRIVTSGPARRISLYSSLTSNVDRLVFDAFNRD